MPYKVGVLPAARRGLRRLPANVQRRVASRIDGLVNDPRPHGAANIVGPETDVYRLRVGDYRIVYHVDDESQVVLVLAAGHRRDVYRPR